jgi:microcystin-dependent protein
MAKIYGALEVAQLEWFTNAGKPAASSYPYRVIYVTDLKQIQVSDGTNWLPSNLNTATSGTLPAASSANQFQVYFITDTLQIRVSNGTKWTTVGARLDTYTSGTIPAAASNTNQMIWVSDLQQVQVSNGTSWVQVGSKVGSKNYFSQNNANPDFETNSVSPWSACTLTFSSGAPTGVPTLTATQMAISVTGTTPLAGTYSMLCTKSAANAQYQGFISGVLTIDREDVAKVMYGSFNYEVTSGTVDMSGTSTQTYEIWIYNVVGNQWIQPAGFRGMNQSSGSGKVVFSFQTDGSFANNQYRVAVITQQTSTAASVVEFDSFAVGPTAISVVQLRNPAGTIIATGSLTPPSGYLYCDGTAISRTDYAELFAAIGTTYGIGNGTTTFNIPDLRGIFARGAGTNPSNAANTTTIGTRQLDDFKSHTHSWTGLGRAGVGGDPNYFQYGSAGGTNNGNMNASNGSTGGTETRPANVGVAYHICFSSGYVQMSNDTDTRVVTAKFNTLQNRTINNTSPAVLLENLIFDTHGAYNTSTGVYTVPVSGYYKISGYLRGSAIAVNGNFTGFVLRLNGSVVAGNTAPGICGTRSSAANSYNPEATGSNIFRLNAGDQLAFGGFSDTASTTFNDGFTCIGIERVTGPSAIAASETVAAIYQTSAGQSIPFNVETVVVFGTKIYDSHSAMNAATGVYTCPISGEYEVSGGIYFASAITATATDVQFIAYKNGTPYLGVNNPKSGTAATPMTTSGTIKVRCNAGDTLSIAVKQNNSASTAQSLITSAAFNWASITRVGN